MSATVQIERIRPQHILAVTRMVYANMIGVDVDFTQLTGTPLRRALSYLFVPFYLLTAGSGYLARHQGEIAGCGYYHLRQLSGFVFNVSVNAEHRRQGVASHLMHYLQQQIRDSGKRWVALHVDRDNLAAQSLYQRLGYRPYHPYFLRRSQLTSPGRVQEQQALEELPRRIGSQRFRAFLRREREAGDPQTAAVVQADYSDTVPSGGRFCGVQHEGQDVGALWLGETGSTRQAMLALEPLWWDRTDLYETLLTSIVNAGGGENQATALELYLGSSTHHEATAATWQQAGFEERRRARILMLKSLEDGIG